MNRHLRGLISNTVRNLRSRIPASLKGPIRRFREKQNLRKSWLTRVTKPGDDHIQIYWNAESQPNRILLLKLLSDQLSIFLKNERPASVLEYGSHVGLNLKLLKREQLAAPVTYYAVEPNEEAVSFLNVKLPFVNVLCAEDESFCSNNMFPPADVNVSFVNSVFYSMTSKRVRSVLRKLSKISDVIIIGESILNIDGEASRMCENPTCFEHPYRRWLQEFGFSIESIYGAPQPVPQLNGYIVAKRIKASNLS